MGLCALMALPWLNVFGVGYQQGGCIGSQARGERERDPFMSWTEHYKGLVGAESHKGGVWQWEG